MTKIDWDEFKNFKKYTDKKGDNFQLLLFFLQSYYNMTNPDEMYQSMKYDDIAPMMLEKRDIKSSADLEKLLYSYFE